MDFDYEDVGGENFSLEEILAEFKGISYIEGDKKTPKDVLDEKARRIVHEEMGTVPPEAPPQRVDFEEVASYLPIIEERQAQRERAAESHTDEDEVRVVSAPAADASVPTAPTEPQAPPPLADDDFDFDVSIFEEVLKSDSAAANGAVADTDFERVSVRKKSAQRTAEPVAEEPKVETEVPRDTVAEASAPETISTDDADAAFFGNYKYSSSDPDEELVRSVNEAIERETADQAEPRRGFRFGDGATRTASPRFTPIDYDNEPDYRERARAFATRCNSLAGRAMFSLALSIILVVFTIIAERGGSLPFGVGKNPIAAAGLLLIFHVFVMLLGLDLLIIGSRDLVSGSASAESLVFVSNLVTVVAGISGMVMKFNTIPFCAVSALSLSFALWGERLYMEALADSLRSVAKFGEPHSVISEYRRDLDRPMLRKASGRYRGFYGNLTQADVCETAYTYAVPLLLLVAVLSAVLTSAMAKDYVRMPYVFASLTAAAATFTSTLAFASPFRRAVRRAKSYGAVIAGAGGADDIFYTEGFCLTDEDLYPPDSLNVSNIRVLDQVTLEKAMRYTASLIIASGSCLARVFNDMLIKDGMNTIATQDFAASEGGVSALIRGENVHVGSFAFMNLYGIRVPDELKLGNAVYTAVNGRLIAMFSVDYRPNDRITTSLSSLLKRGMRPSLTVRDFNITPHTIEQKFKLPMESFDLMSVTDVYSTGGADTAGQGRAAAISARGSLRDLAEVVATGRRLKAVSLISTIVSIASAAIGVFIMAVLGQSSSYGAAKPGKLLLFMVVPLVITIAFELIVEAVMTSNGSQK